jgi:AAA15 family ATPase/GTPase
LIKSVRIRNFQSHKDSELIFNPGVNTIIGTSDQGKSSIFRALNFCITNKPDGTAFVSNWCKNKKGNINSNTDVSIQIDDDTVSRVKGKDNKYILNDKELTAFNKAVPDDVETVFGLTDINIQHQADDF